MVRRLTALGLLTAILLVGTAPAADASSHDAAPAIHLAVASPDPRGTDSLFGHSYLVVKWPGNPTPIAYSYQIYKPETDRGPLPSAAIGRAVMDLVAKNATALHADYAAQGRGVQLSPLQLTDGQAWDLATLLDATNRDEGEVPYHMIDDNCSTRLLDLVDQAMEGSLKSATSHGSGKDVRDLGVPYLMHKGTSLHLWLFLYGPSGDRELTVAETSFIPIELERVLRGAGMAGPATVHHTATLVQPHPGLPLAVEATLGAVALATALALAAWGMRRASTATHRSVGALLVLAGVSAGALSAFILTAWDGRFGPHLASNQNLLVASPLAWLLIPLGAWMGRGPRTAWHGVAVVAVASLVMLAVALFMRFVPGVTAQDNLSFIGLGALFWGGLLVLAVQDGVRLRQPMTPISVNFSGR